MVLEVLPRDEGLRRSHQCSIIVYITHYIIIIIFILSDKITTREFTEVYGCVDGVELLADISLPEINFLLSPEFCPNS